IELARVRYLALLGRIDEAKQHLAALRERFPDEVEVLTTEGRIAFRELRAEDALQAFSRAYEKQADNIRLLDLARLGMAMGRGEEQASLVGSWLEKNPEDLWVRSQYAE